MCLMPLYDNARGIATGYHAYTAERNTERLDAHVEATRYLY
jgi:hypothetical protein